MGVPSQFILAATLQRAAYKQIGVYSNILKQINAKVRQDLYKLDLPCYKNTMIVGIDAVHEASKRLVGCSSSYNQAKTQYYTRLYVQPNPKD